MLSWNLIIMAFHNSSSKFIQLAEENQHIIKVDVVDMKGVIKEKSITLTNSDPIDIPVNNVPVFTESPTTTRSVAENTPAEEKIEDPISATDADGDRLQYFISGTDYLSFNINTNTGQLKTRIPLDYEIKNEYNIQILVRDRKAGGIATINVIIFVTDVEKEEALQNSSMVISEIMLASDGGKLLQWIEFYNRSATETVNLERWTLEIKNHLSNNFDGHQHIKITFKKLLIKPEETLLIVSKQGRGSKNITKNQIYDVSTTHPDLQNFTLNEEAFNIKLINAANELIDEVGNLMGDGNVPDKLAWSLPKGVTEEGARTSMIRRQNEGISLPGTEASGWISAINTKLATNTTHYYGHPDDIGAPGIGNGHALPVQLSRFRADRTEAGVVIKWTTESEVDNAGFYILRSQTKNGTFTVVNREMIKGAGTTGEQNEYTWIDDTTKQNVVYYYRIEDVSFSGVRQQLATVHMKGYVSAVGKFTTTWVDVKKWQ